MNVALIGYGYWGINLARTIQETEGVELYTIFDLDAERIQEAHKLYDFHLFSSLDALFASNNIEAIFIATPPASHYNVAKKALNAGKHIFVEKPFTLRLEDTYDLINIAEKKDLIYMVDHVFIYSEPVKFLKKNIHDFGEIVYINSRRINLGLFQYTTDVIWDLAVHDLSIINHLVGLDIIQTSVFKKKYKNFPNEAIANINLELACDTVINLNVSWLSPVKVREMIIGGTKMSAVYDDTLVNPITLYDAGIVLEQDLSKSELYQHMVKYNYGETQTPILPKNSSLTNAVKHFAECVSMREEPLTGKESILKVMQALEIISKVG